MKNLAVAYAMKKKGKRMAEGGEAKDKGPKIDQGAAKKFVEGFNKPGTMAEGWSNLKKGLGMAKGGMIGSHQSGSKPSVDGDLMDGAHRRAEMESGFMNHEGDVKRPNSAAMSEDGRELNQHGAEEVGPMGAYAEGGQITNNEQSDSHMLDMVGRIIAQRAKCYSKGGQVANDVSPIADSMPAEYDDLVLDDSETPSQDNDSEIGDEQESHDRHDIVARIIKSRSKKDRMPRPA